mmetsp:Transcript_20958/g.60521  ORF Transcript_20958/g.60521 Transcript_20958/m.60521 type:complete len:228 (-) Transcript_20958:105-788(-)
MAAWCCGTEVSKDVETIVSMSSAFGETAADPWNVGVPPSEAFIAVINKATEDMPAGLQLDICDGRVAYIADLRRGKPTPVLLYNAKTKEARQVRAGDYLEGVNGVRGDAKTVSAALVSSKRLELHIRRPSLFPRRVVREKGERLGLDLGYSEHGSSLVINSIMAGSAARRCAPDLAVGDRIVSVNGFTGTGMQLLDAIKTPEQLDLIISRYEPPPSLDVGICVSAAA